MAKIKSYDAIIIGSGQGGNPLMFDLANRGKKVAMIEKNELGGSCINFGCTPTKTLIASSNLFYRVQNSDELGIITRDTELDFKKVMDRKNNIIKYYRASIEDRIKKNKNIELYKGVASFIDKNNINISLNEGGEQQIRAEKIYINTGAKSNIIALEGLENVDYHNSTSIMELTELPEHLLIIGTGYIALEFGQMFRRFGSKVTMVGKSKRIINREDQELSSRIQEILEKEGIKFFLEANIKRVEQVSDKITLYIEKNQLEEKIECTHLMFATGRLPSTQELKLENTKVKLSDKGNIKVDFKLKTNEDNIYALGDVNGGPQFTHISYDDYRIIVDNIYGEGKRNTKDRLVPYTLFTDPQLGRVGLTEAQAIEKGYNIETKKIEMKYLGRAIEEGMTKGFMKAVINKDDHKILGVTILGYQGGEIMAMVQIAMMAGMSYEELRDGIFSHPSLSEGLNNLFSS